MTFQTNFPQSKISWWILSHRDKFTHRCHRINKSDSTINWHTLDTDPTFFSFNQISSRIHVFIQRCQITNFHSLLFCLPKFRNFGCDNLPSATSQYGRTNARKIKINVTTCRPSAIFRFLLWAPILLRLYWITHWSIYFSFSVYSWLCEFMTWATIYYIISIQYMHNRTFMLDKMLSRLFVCMCDSIYVYIRFIRSMVYSIYLTRMLLFVCTCIILISILTMTYHGNMCVSHTLY